MSQHPFTTKALSRALLAFVVLGAINAAAPLAHAGTYVVNGTCGTWSPFNSEQSRIAVYPECPALVVRNVIGNFTTDRGSEGGGWRFDPPAGTGVNYIKLAMTMTGGKSWSSRISVFDNGAELFIADCTLKADCRTSGGQAPAFDSSGPIIARVHCFDGPCPNDGNAPRARIRIAESSITLSDPSAPTVSIAGGSLTGGGWYAGSQTLAVSGSDNTGIRAARALVNGDARYSQNTEVPCDYSKPLPCQNRDGIVVGVNLAGLPDGQYSIAGQADDAAGNQGTSGPLAINVDNTPPVAPVRPRLAGGTGWRTRNDFTVTWANPAQGFAPIAGAAYRLCPKGHPLTSSACVSNSVSSADLSRLAVAVPGPGVWRMRVWLIDAAGNAAMENGVTVGGLQLVAGRRAADGSKRIRTRLTAGGRSGSRRAANLRSVRLGRSLKIKGRLSGGKRRRGLAGERILVYRRVSVEGARFKPVGRVRTGKRGRYRYKTEAGPSQTLRFVYPGGARRQGRIADVRLRVRAKLSIRADARKVRNGDYVTLDGRLRGGRIPPGGALLELRVFSRGVWRPFATPRTDRKGKWVYPYRFETVTGNAKFRFRAVLRKQATYPFTARSKAIAVKVKGI